MQTVLSPPTPLWCADRLSASIDGPGLQRTSVFDKPYILVGSSEHCDIVVPLIDVPPVALYIHVTDAAICWLDLSSPAAQWRCGSFASTGRLVWRGYHFALERLAATSADRALCDAEKPMLIDAIQPDERPADTPVFDIAFQGERLARAKLTSTITLVGQSQRCRLRLRNRHVSRDHCLFYVAGRQSWVVDLLSDEGTFVRGRAIAASPVFAGDVVTIGKPTMTLVRWSHRKPVASNADFAPDSAIAISGDTAATLDLNELSDTNLAAATGEKAPHVESPLERSNTTGSEDDRVASNSALVFAPNPEAFMPRRAVPLADTVADIASFRDTVIVPGATHATAPTNPQIPNPESRPPNFLQPPVPNPQPPLPDPSLDRLIVRHKHNYRRAIVRWSIASGVILAAFLSAVVWASRNLDFYGLGPALELDSGAPSAMDAPSGTNDATRAGAPDASGDRHAEPSRP